MIIYRVQRVSDSIDNTVEALRHFSLRKAAEKYAEKIRPKIAAEAFYRKVEVVEVEVH